MEAVRIHVLIAFSNRRDCVGALNMDMPRFLLLSLSLFLISSQVNSLYNAANTFSLVGVTTKFSAPTISGMVPVLDVTIGRPEDIASTNVKPNCSCHVNIRPAFLTFRLGEQKMLQCE